MPYGQLNSQLDTTGQLVARGRLSDGHIVTPSQLVTNGQFLVDSQPTGQLAAGTQVVANEPVEPCLHHVGVGENSRDAINLNNLCRDYLEAAKMYHDFLTGSINFNICKDPAYAETIRLRPHEPNKGVEGFPVIDACDTDKPDLLVGGSQLNQDNPCQLFSDLLQDPTVNKTSGAKPTLAIPKKKKGKVRQIMTKHHKGSIQAN
ncbi:hypothetical protein MJO28_017939 [Puccinia striiformis f. sp. tritici]|nr:hypothetical protein MJO28_017939 [Puccinia striiformis f. sp. tritici]